MADTVDVRMLRLEFLFGNPNSLYGEQSILRAAITLFANAGFLAPQITVDRITLRHFVVAIALGKVHASAVGKFAKKSDHLPLDVRGRALGRITEKDLVLDLQASQLRIEKSQFFVGGHRRLHDECSHGTRDGAGTCGSRRG